MRRRTALPFSLFLIGSCARLPDKPHYKVLELRGTHYEMGLEHGRALCPAIRSLYTRFLATSVLPYLNRYRSMLTPLPFPYYSADPAFAGDRFSYALLLESARTLEPYIPEAYRDEMHGIADGCGLPYEQVLVMNTFLDTLLGLLSAADFVTAQNAPRITSVEILPAGPARSPYDSSPFALFTEIPGTAGFRWSLASGDGVDPSTVEVALDGTTYDTTRGVTVAPTAAGADVRFSPPSPMTPGEVHRVLLEAGNRHVDPNPPPPHEAFMRPERIAFSTQGYGRAPSDIPNGDVGNPLGVASSVSVGVRGSATRDGGVYVARNFVLLDNNTAHDHTALFVYHPDGGRAHVVLGWAGTVWALSGMNEDGLVACIDPADTLNNSVAANVLRDLIAAHLVARGIPGGILARRVLEGAADVPAGESIVRASPRTYGWNLLLASGRSQALEVLETDSNVLEAPDGGVFPYGPESLSPATGRPYASVGTDDVATSSVFLKNVEDVDPADPRLQIGVGSIQVEARPQRSWAPGYFTALTALESVESRLAAGYGTWDAAGLVGLLRDPMLTDVRNNMHSAVFDATRRTVYVAMGGLPANAGPFIPFTARELDLP